MSIPLGATPTIPFRVLRSKNRNLPVYTDYKSGRNQVLTSVRKIEGNIQVKFKHQSKFTCIYVTINILTIDDGKDAEKLFE